MRMGEYFDESRGRPIADTYSATIIRPQLSEFFQNESNTAGSDAAAAGLGVEEVDFVVQRATAVGITAPLVAPQARLSQLEVGKCWMLGFLEWYCAAPLLQRGDTANHRLAKDDCDAGKLIMARRTYRKIDWSLEYIALHDSLWNATSVSAADLGRVGDFWDRARVQTWHVVRGTFGYVRMPLTLAYSGQPLTLGWEITHDWIRPVDANHGVGLLTISHMVKEIHKYNSVGASLQTSIRRVTAGYEFTSGNRRHIIALGQQTGDVVTCYRV